MGWRDNDIDKVMDRSLSNAQLYKMAGNSFINERLKMIFKFLDV